MLQIAVFGAEADQVPEEVRSMATEINYYSYESDEFLETLGTIPNLILCFPGKEMSALEIAQSLRMNYSEISIFFIATDKKDFDKKKLIKNGFSGAYLLPWEKADFMKALKEESVYSLLPELRDYKPIKVVDLKPGAVLDFAVRIFLPRNNMLLPFSLAGDPVSEGKMAKLQESNLNTLFVHKDDVDKFYQYTADIFKKLLRPNALSETEKQEKLEKSVRELLSDMYIEDNRENTFGKSQSLLKEVKEVINILMMEDNADLISKVNMMINQEENFYLHLSNVSTYAGLFALILGIEKPEEMALAGLLHDIGKINLPIEIASLEMSQMGKEALAAYKNHPKSSLDLIRLKRLVIPERVSKAILQHHEAINGSGYPSGLDGTRISKEGKLLAIANTFDHMTAMKSGEPNLSVKDAFIKLHEMNSSDPGRVTLDVDMLKKLKEFFTKE